MTESTPVRLSVVVPTFNEGENVTPLYDRVRRAITGHISDYEFIFVDDGSSDDTEQAVLALRQRDPNVKLITLSRNFGHQPALTAGMHHASGDIIVCMDGDLQHPPELIPEMIRQWRLGYRVVMTRREDGPRQSSFKKVTSRVFYFLINKISSVSIDVNAADFYLLDRSVGDAINGLKERHRFLRGLVNWVGYEKKTLPYAIGERQFGATKYSLKKMARLAFDGIISFSAVPLILATVFGALISMMSFLYGCFVIYQRFFSAMTPPGWTSLLASLLFLNGLLMLFLGIIGVYISAIYNEVKNRPVYLIKSSAGLDALQLNPSGQPGAMDGEASSP